MRTNQACAISLTTLQYNVQFKKKKKPTYIPPLHNSDWWSVAASEATAMLEACLL